MLCLQVTTRPTAVSRVLHTAVKAIVIARMGSASVRPGCLVQRVIYHVLTTRGVPAVCTGVIVMLRTVSAVIHRYLVLYYVMSSSYHIIYHIIS